MVEASPDTPARLRRIQVQMELSSHPNKLLQLDWDAAGADGFDFDVLDVLPPSHEPDTDISQELEVLLDLWTEKLDIDPNTSY